MRDVCSSHKYTEAFNLSHSDTRGAAVIFHSSAAAAATFDRAWLPSQSSSQPLLLACCCLFFFYSNAALCVRCVGYPFSYSFACVSYPASRSTHSHTNTYTHLFIHALLRTNTTTNKGVIFCAIFFFFTLWALLSSKTNFSKPRAQSSKLIISHFPKTLLRLFNAAAQSSSLCGFYHTHSLSCNINHHLQRAGKSPWKHVCFEPREKLFRKK